MEPVNQLNRSRALLISSDAHPRRQCSRSFLLYLSPPLPLVLEDPSRAVSVSLPQQPFPWPTGTRRGGKPPATFLPHSMATRQASLFNGTGMAIKADMVNPKDAQKIMELLGFAYGTKNLAAPADEETR